MEKKGALDDDEYEQMKQHHLYYLQYKQETGKGDTWNRKHRTDAPHRFGRAYSPALPFSAPESENEEIATPFARFTMPENPIFSLNLPHQQMICINTQPTG